jgi:hypothetical protein
VPVKTFVTMGPGTNHELVSRKYLAFHGLPTAALSFVSEPWDGARLVLDGRVDYLILCSVHPDAPTITGRHFRELFIVDTFISSSKPLAILTRREVANPRRLGIFAPTRDYADTSKWSEVVVEAERSLVQIWQRLLAGEYDSALVYLEYAEGHANRVVVDQVIGSPDDAWLVFGRERASDGGPVVCRDSVLSRQIVGR